MKLKDLLQEASLPLPCESELGEIEITGISSDSRTVKRGELFVALRGLRQDGCMYVGEALKKGAAFILSECALEGGNTLMVQDARGALARLYDAWYGHPAAQMSLIGITGTNGKTSCATMLFEILRYARFDTGLIGTVGCKCNEEVLTAKNPEHLANMTTPDPAELYKLLDEMRARGVRYVVMEVTSHALCLGKTAPLFFKRAVFTNLSVDHLDFHGDMESYFGEKAKLFTRCEEAVISCFTPYGERLCDMIECPAYEVSSRTVRDIKTHGIEGVSFTLTCPDGERISVNVPVPGRFSVENAALAVLTALSLGISKDTAIEALASFDGVKGRMERTGENPFGVTVFLDYAHTPDALEKLLLSVREFATPTQRIVLLFGCGGDRDRSKRREMGRIASRLADRLILTSDNCRSEDPARILADILRGVDKEKPYSVIEDRKEAILFAVQEARKGDILVFAGKGHEEYEIRGRARLPFSERKLVEQAFAARAKEAEREDSTAD